MGLFKKKKKKSDDFSNVSISEEEFVKLKRKEGIGLKSSLIEYAALQKGFSVNRVSKRIVIVKSDQKEIGFSLMNGEHSSRVGSIICTNKQETREFLKLNELNVTDSKVFNDTEFDNASDYAEAIGFPVVVKPISLSRGRGISVNIKSKNELENSWLKAIKAYKKKKKRYKILVEKHFFGEDFRFYVVGDRLVSATHRKRPNVIGDGKSSVIELIKEKNSIRRENPYLEEHLIPEDYSLLDNLHANQIELDFVPERGQEIILRNVSNVDAGGDNIDVTDIAHPDYRDIAVKAIKAIPGIQYGGVDIIADDITIKPNKLNYIVSEVEFAPAPLAHFPYKGKRKDMAGAIIDYYFH